MTIGKIFSRLISFVVFLVCITSSVFASCNPRTGSTPSTILKKTAINKEPSVIFPEPTKFVAPTGTTYPTINSCNPDIVYQRENVRWVEWTPLNDEIYYGINYYSNFSSYSISEGKVYNRNESYKNYVAGLTSQFGIDHKLTNKVSPDNLKIVFVDGTNENITAGSNHGQLTSQYTSKIYIKSINQTEVFISEIEGAVEDFHWSLDSKNVVIVMSPYSTSSSERGSIYLLNTENNSLQVILPFSESLSGYSFHGFSLDNQWVFIAADESTWMWNIQDYTKKYFQLPENRISWWGNSSELVLVQLNEGEESQFSSVNSSFYWYKIREDQLIPTSISNYSINPWQSKILTPSSSWDYLAIIDKDNRLFIVKLCSR